MDSTVISPAGREYLRLHLTPDVGPRRLKSLIAHFGSIQAVMGASQAELQHVDGIGPKIAEALLRARDTTPVDKEIARAAEHGARILCPEDAEYPRSLLPMSDPPTCLYVRGALQPTDAVAIGVVGTRKCSQYGLEQAGRFAELLAAAGFTIVSGLARGIDAAAHRGAMRANGRTIGVLGNGLSRVYPPEHADLAKAIVDGSSGAVVSELPMDTGPEAKNFPGRNRLIAGLTVGTIVVEAGIPSGALITAHQAIDYGREVFAIPGRIDQPQRTAGVHSLLRDGKAKLITCLEDILDELGDVGTIMARGLPAAQESDVSPVRRSPDGSVGWLLDVHGRDDALAGPIVDQPAGGVAAPVRAAVGLSAVEEAVLAAIRDGAELPDHVHARTDQPIERIFAALTSLQLKGLIRQLPGSRFAPRS
jgi:DNA processing protein